MAKLTGCYPLRGYQAKPASLFPIKTVANKERNWPKAGEAKCVSWAKRNYTINLL